MIHRVKAKTPKRAAPIIRDIASDHEMFAKVADLIEREALNVFDCPMQALRIRWNASGTNVTSMSAAFGLGQVLVLRQTRPGEWTFNYRISLTSKKGPAT